ncbi:MAG: aminotransferase class V-fold PLP-dependent enzyme [Nitrospirae bacterium]|nr:aminotransferase class V-fold PLP-dependent enzyme [Nitrospirota bacterium]NTW65136.1 aminotransferase class V-fold PLP-dependent enzyme [Nitrospirota bacterium]
MDDKTVEKYRREFPVIENYIYLDHAGVAPISLRVRSAVEVFLRESSEGGAFHYPAWTHKVNEVRTNCARLIHAEADEIAIVKNTSHGLSLVAEGIDWKAGENILFYEREFPSNIYPWQNLKRKGVEARTIPFTRGKVQIEDIEKLIDSRTRMVSVSSVQFANGFRVDLKRLGGLCRDRNILFCVDAIQSLGVIPMDVRDCNVDFLSADAHKWLLGPEGVGMFYCRKELAEHLTPPLIGWKSVQSEFDFDQPHFVLKRDAQRFEEGSMNLMGIFGLGAAIDLLLEAGMEDIEQRVLDLGDKIIKEADKRGFEILTPRERHERGGNVTFRGNFELEAVRSGLREKGIMVNVRGGGLRVSPHFYNIEPDIERLFEAVDGMI